MAVKTGSSVAEVPAAIILNPTAGAGRGRRARSILEAAAGAWSPRPRLMITAAPGDATALARRCSEEGAGLVIAAGGDGTAHEVVRGLMEFAGAGGAPPTFGYVPLGTGCDLAIALGLPREPGGLLEDLRAGSDVRIDVGELETEGPRPQRRWFLNAANVGLGPIVAERVASSPRLRRWGTPAYLVAAARALLRMSPRDLSWETDEGRVGEGPVVNLSVCNGPSFGGGMRPCPDATLESGRLHVAVVEPLGVPAALGQIPRLMRGRRLDHPSIHNFSCREIRIASRRPGETTGPPAEQAREGAAEQAREGAAGQAREGAAGQAREGAAGQAREGAAGPSRQEPAGRTAQEARAGDAEGVPVEIDGEISGPLPVRLRVVPRGLAVRLPREGARSFDGSG